MVALTADELTAKRAIPPTNTLGKLYRGRAQLDYLALFEDNPNAIVVLDIATREHPGRQRRRLQALRVHARRAARARRLDACARRRTSSRRCSLSARACRAPRADRCPCRAGCGGTSARTDRSRSSSSGVSASTSKGRAAALVVVSNVSDRVHAEAATAQAVEALRQSEERFRALIENSADGIALSTRTGGSRSPASRSSGVSAGSPPRCSVRRSSSGSTRKMSARSASGSPQALGVTRGLGLRHRAGEAPGRIVAVDRGHRDQPARPPRRRRGRRELPRRHRPAQARGAAAAVAEDGGDGAARRRRSPTTSTTCWASSSARASLRGARSRPGAPSSRTSPRSRGPRRAAPSSTRKLLAFSQQAGLEDASRSTWARRSASFFRFCAGSSAKTSSSRCGKRESRWSSTRTPCSSSKSSSTWPRTRARRCRRAGGSRSSSTASVSTRLAWRATPGPAWASTRR